jgi:hypothetical protein
MDIETRIHHSSHTSESLEGLESFIHPWVRCFIYELWPEGLILLVHRSTKVLLCERSTLKCSDHIVRTFLYTLFLLLPLWSAVTLLPPPK